MDLLLAQVPTTAQQRHMKAAEYMAKTMADAKSHGDDEEGRQILRSKTLGGKTLRKKHKKMKKQQLQDLLSSVQTGDQSNLELGIDHEVHQEAGDVLSMLDSPSQRPSRKGSWQVRNFHILTHTKTHSSTFLSLSMSTHSPIRSPSPPHTPIVPPTTTSVPFLYSFFLSLFHSR